MVDSQVVEELSIEQPVLDTKATVVEVDTMVESILASSSIALAVLVVGIEELGHQGYVTQGPMKFPNHLELVPLVQEPSSSQGKDIL